MNKTRLCLIIFACIISSCISSAFALGSGTWAWGNLTLTNGEKLDSVYFHMPLNYDSKITVKLNGSKIKIQSDSIDLIVLWHQKHPEEKTVIKYYAERQFLPKTGKIEDIIYKKDSIPLKLWVCLEQVGPHCTAWHNLGRPSFKGGHFRVNHNKMWSHLSMGYLKKTGEDKITLIPSKDKEIPPMVELFFSQDPVLLEKFKNGDYNRSDWGYKYWDFTQMVNDYTPSPQPQSTTQ